MAAVLAPAHPISCPTCGTSATSSPHEHTELLESELRNLTEKYLTVSNQLRELQEEHHRRARSTTIRSTSTEHTPEARTDTAAAAVPATPRPTAGLTRFASSFRLPTTLSPLSSSSSPNSDNKPGTPGSGSASGRLDLFGLQRELANETAAREEAERKASDAHTELEDLTAQLFEQANLMVASERRANAKLGERVAVLEQRDREKARRFERIEGALKRIERVRTLLGKG